MWAIEILALHMVGIRIRDLKNASIVVEQVLTVIERVVGSSQCSHVESGLLWLAYDPADLVRTQAMLQIRDITLSQRAT